MSFLAKSSFTLFCAPIDFLFSYLASHIIGRDKQTVCCSPKARSNESRTCYTSNACSSSSKKRKSLLY